ncbi:MAG: hypothetical protein HY813_03140 [Candidatus Portnoybacteria bacterium]|nr:hypothetical protein [Candidatus Portnoybacteria bacterium]
MSIFPRRVIVSEKTIEKGNVEIKKRDSKEAKLIRPQKLFEAVNRHIQFGNHHSFKYAC